MNLFLLYHEDQRIRHEARNELNRRFDSHVRQNLVLEREVFERRESETIKSEVSRG